MSNKKKLELGEIGYVKLVTIGSINPNAPLSDKSREEQAAVLNRCLNEYPKGIIIGKDIALGSYMAGEHQLTMERVTYHVGFERRPAWEKEENSTGGNGNV